LPQWEFVTGHDTNVHVAVLSRFPIVARRSHTNDSFLLDGRKCHVSRGFAEVDIQVNATYRFTLFSAHLKSRRIVPEADEAELRAQEALLLREKIEARLRADPNANIIVLGDFNDVKDSRTVRAVIGRGKQALIDTRPTEQNGAGTSTTPSHRVKRDITWTHFFSKEDVYSRVDYILISRGLKAEWLPEQTYVLAAPGWGIASDHRPLVAAFSAADQ
jgi:endonuclease/exonuclease/phosphatase family metal-dependent hydrolase